MVGDLVGQVNGQVHSELRFVSPSTTRLGTKKLIRSRFAQQHEGARDTTLVHHVTNSMFVMATFKFVQLINLSL